MSKVFVVQEDSSKNILSALSYGDVEVIMPEGSNITFAPAAAIRTIRTKMNKFTEDDWVICIGDPIAIGIACAVASEKTGGKFNILKWDRQERRYYPVRVDISSFIAPV